MTHGRQQPKWSNFAFHSSNLRNAPKTIHCPLDIGFYANQYVILPFAFTSKCDTLIHKAWQNHARILSNILYFPLLCIHIMGHYHFCITAIWCCLMSKLSYRVRSPDDKTSITWYRAKCILVSCPVLRYKNAFSYMCTECIYIWKYTALCTQSFIVHRRIRTLVLWYYLSARQQFNHVSPYSLLQVLITCFGCHMVSPVNPGRMQQCTCWCLQTVSCPD